MFYSRSKRLSSHLRQSDDSCCLGPQRPGAGTGIMSHRYTGTQRLGHDLNQRTYAAGTRLSLSAGNRKHSQGRSGAFVPSWLLERNRIHLPPAFAASDADIHSSARAPQPAAGLQGCVRRLPRSVEGEASAHGQKRIPSGTAANAAQKVRMYGCNLSLQAIKS